MLLALILSLTVGPVLVTAAVCEWGYLKDDIRCGGVDSDTLTATR